MDSKNTPKDSAAPIAKAAPVEKPAPEQKESPTKKISVTLTATQFNFGDTLFAGQEVKMIHRDVDGKIIPYNPASDEAPFAIVPYLGGFLKVDGGGWLISFPNGSKAVWSGAEYEQWTSGKDTGDPFSGPNWIDDEGSLNYPQPGRANPNELQEDGSITYPGAPGNPLEPVEPDDVVPPVEPPVEPAKNAKK